MEGSEESSILRPQTDDEKHQLLQQKGLRFQSLSSSSDPDPYPNLDPPLSEHRLKQLLSQELLNLALEQAINEEVQNPARKQTTDEEIALKQDIGEELYYLALEHAIKEALEYKGLSQDVDEEIALKQAVNGEIRLQALKNNALEETGVPERETDHEEDVKNESKKESQSSSLKANKVEEKGLDHKEDVKNENENGDGKDLDEVIDDDDVNENVQEDSGAEEASKDGKYRRYNYPLRPDAEDCPYYMRTGMCKFGSNCKFNHPLRRKNQAAAEKVKQKEENQERPGQTTCKYYLTEGGCKFGKACRYNHNRGKTPVAPILELNFLGLPIRLGEKECPYYMRTGSCKYGSNCRFNHPDPTAVGGGDAPAFGNARSASLQGASQSTVSSWSSPRTLNETAPFMQMMFPPSQGIPSPNPEWNGFQAPAYATSERSLPTPPAFAMNNPAADTNFHTHHQQQLPIEEFPERPGQPECSYFLKTGDCKYRSNCKFHHPKGRIPNTPQCLLSGNGLPLRRDQSICTYYSRYGICKFGPACKFDHPPNYENSASSAGSGPDHPPPFGNGSESLFRQPL